VVRGTVKTAGLHGTCVMWLCHMILCDLPDDIAMVVSASAACMVTRKPQLLRIPRSSQVPLHVPLHAHPN
jgi:hypothetical protein